MFVGRRDYLDRFATLWRKKVPSLVVCRGRRRIGKSTLVREFARQSGGLYLKLEGLAPDGYMTNAKQLAAFRDQLAAQTGREVPRLKDWADAFRELDSALAGKGRKVVLLDEVSWMGGYDRTFPAKLKVAWDNLSTSDPISCCSFADRFRPGYTGTSFAAGGSWGAFHWMRWWTNCRLRNARSSGADARSGWT